MERKEGMRESIHTSPHTSTPPPTLQLQTCCDGRPTIKPVPFCWPAVLMETNADHEKCGTRTNSRAFQLHVFVTGPTMDPVRDVLRARVWTSSLNTPGRRVSLLHQSWRGA
ncbi:uncharacterized protein LOC143476717 [Brachyhypopomus gauderio]|uniref:uncharacterized protein LOC143476717 n=1 Tax=Brachyhypopomus gauderio TaxID=698409 RepID=UPI00404198F0